MLTESSCGSVVVYVIPESSTLLPKVRFRAFTCLFTGSPSKLILAFYFQDVKVYVGQRRTALLRTAPFKSSWSLKEVLSNLDLQVEQIVSTMSFSHQDIVAALSDRVRMTKVTKESMADSMRAIKSSPGEYSLSFWLVFSKAYTYLKLYNLISPSLRLRDHVQSAQPRPKVAQSSLGYRGRPS